MVSRSDGYIDVHSIGGPLYEELDYTSAPPVGPYDVPQPPYVYMGCMTASANPAQQPPDVNVECITTANPAQQPHYENAKH